MRRSIIQTASIWTPTAIALAVSCLALGLSLFLKASGDPSSVVLAIAAATVGFGGSVVLAGLAVFETLARSPRGRNNGIDPLPSPHAHP